jgi:ParB/RepB/Spo0J family partition protein
MALMRGARARIEKRRYELNRHTLELTQGPQGEALSKDLTQQVENVPLELVKVDPNFQNLRLPPSDDELQRLSDSMSAEGLHLPIQIIPANDADCYYIRAGFRRTLAAKKLRWQSIPALILPQNTPLVSEYWTNVIENSARDKLSSYEIAHAAQTMREKFDVSPREFALKAGFSESYVMQLLRCIDRLPPEIVELWAGKAPIPVALYDRWSNMTPEEAINQLHIYRGRNPKIVKDWAPPTNLKKKPIHIKMASAIGLSRMQRLRFAIEVERSLDEKTRGLCVQIVDFCTGARDHVEGVFDNGRKLRMYRSRRKQDLEGEVQDIGALVEEAKNPANPDNAIDK